MKTIVGLYGARSGSSKLGRFASEIAAALRDSADFDVVLLDSEDSPKHLDSVVYASRTSTKLKGAAQLCAAHDIPLYVLSSDMDDEVAQVKSTCNVIPIANSSLEVQEFLRDVTKFHQSHPDWTLTITEYHQESKQDVSGTALQLVHTLGLGENCITSIRNDNKAGELFKIPEEYKDGYAVHRVEFTSPDTHTSHQLQITVIGRKSYTYGLLEYLET
ncbi:hypothetical protein KC973_00155 [Candidatus Saccharibacteria bacterium]|nr:hypothetical protein [Candidatus Saccharibacteria bacterium]